MIPTPVPPLPSPHVRRPHLVRRVLGARVVTLAAPVGYGKTALLAEAIHRAGGRHGWYTVTPAAAPDQMLADLAAGMAGWQVPATLVLDDIHHLSAAAYRLLGEWLAAAPPALRVWLAGHRLPPLPGLPRLRLAGAVTELGAADLAFSAAESGKLLAAAGPGAPRADTLHALARGWPAAVRLLGLAAAAGRPHETALCGYVEAEVLAGLPPERRRFLAEAAVLPVWSAAACNFLLECTDAGAHLEWLRQEQALPVDATDGGGQQPHPLWRECLLAELRRDRARHRTLQHRAALWEQAAGRVETALAHALAAGDGNLIEGLLRPAARRLLQAGRLEQLEEQLAAVPPAVQERLPDLLLTAGEAWRRAGRPQRALRWLHGAVQGYAARSQPRGLLRALCRLALAHSDLGNWNAAQSAFAQVAAELDSATGPERAEALLALAEDHAGRGLVEQAAAQYRTAADLFRLHGEPERAGAALAGLGVRVLAASGQPEAALATLREAQAFLDGAAACDALLAELQILAALGRWDEAGALAAGAVPGSPPQQALLCWLQARAAVHRGNLFAAEELCLQGDQVLVEVDRTPALHCVALLARAGLARGAGRPGVAMMEARRAVQLASLARSPILEADARALLSACQPGPAPGSLQVHCLGSFRVQCGAAEIAGKAWGRPQARGLFQFLLLQPGYAAGREAIMDAFWPDETAGRARGALRTILHHLRRTLQESGLDLEATKDAVRLPPDAVGWLDTAGFAAHLSAARQAAAAHPETCLDHCRAARDLYRGDLLAGEFWPWAEELRQRLRRDLAGLLQLWQEVARRLDRHDETAAALEDLLALDPGAELVARELLRCLARAGRLGEALRRYRQLARWLRAELGIDPAPETRALMKELLRQAR